jgi:hypothetical protein
MFFGLSADEVKLRYFRDGPYTQLYLPAVVKSEDGKTSEVSWKFSFQDLGLHFELCRNFSVDHAAGVVTDLETDVKRKMKNKGDMEELRGMLFDHYTSFLSDVYADLGVKPG